MSESTAAAGLERVLHEALAQALRAPKVPPGFPDRLQAALARAPDADLPTVREQLEQERREQIEALETAYIHVRRSTLGTLIGVAFAAGAAAAVALPWLRVHLGTYTPAALAWSGIATGAGIAFFEPLRELLRRWSDAV